MEIFPTKSSLYYARRLLPYLNRGATSNDSASTASPDQPEIFPTPEQHRLALRLAVYVQKESRPRHEEFATISAILHELEYPPNWSQNPRLYYILQKLGQPEASRDFFDAGFTDVWLPFPDRTLRKLLNLHDVKNFSIFQNMCLENKVPLLSEYQHLAVADQADLGFEEESFLGSGGFGEVHAVKYRETGELFAMKSLSRPGVHRDHLNFIKGFQNEIQGMRRVHHHHCVELVASYTDLYSFRLLCSPVADMDLLAYLELDFVSGGARPDCLTRAIGCITSALVYLHALNIRHDDLKPNNILILGEKILLTDFGFSRDFTDSGTSTTTGAPGHFVRKYSAPEVFDNAPRSRLTDIWGLGCVLFEILSRLYGHKPSAMRIFWQSHGTNRDSHAENQAATATWYSTVLNDLEQFEGHSMLASFTYHVLMERDRLSRPTAVQVLDRLKDMDFVTARKHGFVNTCCLQQTPYLRSFEADVAGCFPEYYRGQSTKSFPGIVDANGFDNDVVYLFLDLDLEMINCSKNAHPLADPALSTESCRRFAFQWIFQSKFHFDQIRNMASNIIETVSWDTTPKFVSERDQTLQSLYKTLFLCRLGDTRFYTWILPLVWLDGVERHFLVRLMLVSSCLERQESFGAPFLVLFFDSRGFEAAFMNEELSHVAQSRIPASMPPEYTKAILTSYSSR